MCRGSGRPFP
uniref:Uncharacterized protein n=1 Tax=Arundo donax TaxID=35708 RepID=A0A0A9C8M7_ARUDO